jgi:hypothetical protein
VDDAPQEGSALSGWDWIIERETRVVEPKPGDTWEASEFTGRWRVSLQHGGTEVLVSPWWDFNPCPQVVTKAEPGPAGEGHASE